MTVQLRHPGEATFWTVQVRYRNKPDGDDGAWFTPGDVLVAKVPVEVRCNMEDRRWKGDKEPFLSWGANGEVWQRSGNHGWLEIGQAYDFARHLQEANPDLYVRIVRVKATYVRLETMELLG